MAIMYAAQEATIDALRGIGDPDLADRLERCTTARRERRGGEVGRSPADLPRVYGVVHVGGRRNPGAGQE